MPMPNLTDAEIDQLLERFDLSPVRLQRRIIARFVSDRELLLHAAREAAASSWDRVKVQEVLGGALEIVERPTEES